jgi:hypothetical protein
VSDTGPVAQLNQYMSQAVAALVARDYDTAVNLALAAQAIAGRLPKASRSAGSGGGTQSAAWSATEISEFIVRCRQQQASAVGVQAMNKMYVRPSSYGGAGYQGQEIY